MRRPARGGGRPCSMLGMIVALQFLVALPALAWGSEGHSIVAEIAQRRLSPKAQMLVQRLLGPASLASIGSWADNIREPAGDGPLAFRRHRLPACSIRGGSRLQGAGRGRLCRRRHREAARGPG